MNVRIREQRLPGIGHRYDVSVGADRHLIVIVEREGRRRIAIADPGADEPSAAITLSHDQAVAVAALLTGARFSIETGEQQGSASGDVAVETVTLGEGSPAVGQFVRDVPLLSESEATILAVIRDDTPELVENEVTEPCRVGDRVVVAARRERLAAVVQQLAG